MALFVTSCSGGLSNTPLSNVTTAWCRSNMSEVLDAALALNLDPLPIREALASTWMWSSKTYDAWKEKRANMDSDYVRACRTAWEDVDQPRRWDEGR